MQIQNREFRRTQFPRQLIALAVTAAYHLFAPRPPAQLSLIIRSCCDSHLPKSTWAPWKITLYAADETAANHAAAAAYARIEELNRVLSDYDPESELSRLSDTSPSPEPVPVSNDLWNVLEFSQRLSAQTDGAFDITVGPLSNLWRRARRTKEMPRGFAGRGKRGHRVSRPAIGS